MESMNNTNKCQINSNGSRMMNNNNNNNSNLAGNNNLNGQNNSNNDIRQAYTMAGIVQFLQYEWQRFELQRQQWDVEKAELKARIALIQGERRGQENLKNDLIRRIKMLEYCLKQERAKFHKLKYGVDPPDQYETANDLNDVNFELDENLNNVEQNNLNWKQGRQLLRHYLQEIGYTDTIIDVRSNRVRSLLGLSNLNDEAVAEKNSSKIEDKDEEDAVQAPTSKRMYRRDKRPLRDESNVKDTESSVLATFEFLNSQNNIGFLLDDIGVGDEDEEDDDDVIESPFGSLGNETEDQVMNEFDMMLNNPMEINEREIKIKTPNVHKDMDLGELASLTDADNVIDNGGGSSNNSSEVRKTWTQKFILKSHYDCVRALRFHATEPLLITASEDETLKLWNINKTQSTKNKQPINAINATLDLEPVYTYRGHTSRVLSLCVNGNVFHSGSQNGEIISWSIPSNVMNLDIYDPYDPKLQFSTIKNAHDDCVWSLANMTSPTSNSNILCSASSDRTVKIWDTTRSICLKSLESEDKIPTDLAVIGQTNLNPNISSSSLLVCSYDDGSLALYDIEAHSTSNPVLSFEKVPNSGSIYSIAIHPIMPIVITAHQYKLIKLWDYNTGKCIYSMVAHLDEVTSVDCDPNGWYILSGSHDCSVRIWNFDNKNCVQEMTSHRKKFDEGIFDVAFHPSKPYFASAGAEGLVKVFV